MATDNPLPTTCTPAPGTPACFPVIPVAVVIAVSPRRQAWDLEDTIMNYDTLFSKSLPAPVETHPGLRADTKYVFSVTYADPDCLPAEGLLDALRVAMRTQARDLAKYPPPQGHIGMRELIAQDLKVTSKQTSARYSSAVARAEPYRLSSTPSSTPGTSFWSRSSLTWALYRCCSPGAPRSSTSPQTTRA